MMKIRKLICVCLWIPLCVHAQHISAKFEKPSLIFDMTVSNPSTTDTRYLVKIGVESRPTGITACPGAGAGEGRALLSLADYPIIFSVRARETMVVADPPLELPRGSAARFTISLYPVAAPCGNWTSTVRAIALFDNGSRVYSEPEKINRQDVRERKKDFNQEEVLSFLKHRSSLFRIQGLKLLPKVDIGLDAVLPLVRTKLNDPVRQVRIEAYAIAAEMNLTPLIPDLIKRYPKIFTHTPTDDNWRYDQEVADLLGALGEMKADSAVDLLIAALMDQRVEDFEVAQEALKKLSGGLVISKIPAILEKYSAWAKEKPCPLDLHAPCPEHIKRLESLLDVLISFHAISSVDLIKGLMISKREYVRLVLERLEFATTTIEESEVVRDPFFQSFRSLAHQNVRSPSAMTRASLNDSASAVRGRSAETVGRLELYGLAPLLYAKYRIALGDEKLDMCQALVQLDAISADIDCFSRPKTLPRLMIR